MRCVQFADAFQKYGISAEVNSPVLALEIADDGQSKMDEIRQIIKGDVVDIARLSEMCDHHVIKQVCSMWCSHTRAKVISLAKSQQNGFCIQKIDHAWCGR